MLPVGRSWVAILAGYAGLCALVIYPAPIALALGVLAVLHLRRHRELHGLGRAIFAIATGLLGTLVLILILLKR